MLICTIVLNLLNTFLYKRLARLNSPVNSKVNIVYPKNKYNFKKLNASFSYFLHMQTEILTNLIVFKYALMFFLLSSVPKLSGKPLDRFQQQIA